jgi:hypothetical protein
MTFRVRPEARADIFDAAQWYEDREPGLGVAFIAEIDAAFQRIELGRGHSDIRRPASASRP